VFVLYKILGRLSVGQKLLLIFLLDMSAVAYVSGIMLNEKYLAIDFARKELAGNAYIDALRPGMLALAEVNASPLGAPDPWPAHRGAARAAQDHLGAGMASAAEAQAYLAALTNLRGDADARTLAIATDRGRDLITRVGNQSNLILDPDLDSYYTMSIVLLRMPELLALSTAYTAATLSDEPAAAARLLILEGRLDAVEQGLDSDYREAYASTHHAALRPALEPSRQALMAAIAGLRRAGAQAQGPQGRGSLQGAHRSLVQSLGVAWQAASAALQTLLTQRIDGFFSRMWLHLGTALSLLCLILSAVFFVARQIARPLRQLSRVMDAVAVSGNHALRAHWDSQDEIGRLVRGFNDMLAQLDRGRVLQQELAASARAADAQRELVEALPIPMVVTSIPTHQVLHANLPARQWLGPGDEDPWRRGLAPALRARFFQQLADRDAVDEFEVPWKTGTDSVWAVLSARRLSFLGQDAVLTAFTPVNHLKLMERRLELWAKVFQASSEGILIVDHSHRVLSANQAFCQATHYELGDLVGEVPLFFEAGAGPQALLDRAWAVADQRGSWQGEVQARRRDGSSYQAWMMVSVVRDGPALPQAASEGHTVSHYIVTTLDISDRKRHEERIQFLAEHDVLTELPNRSLCVERLGAALAAARLSGRRVAVLFIDLDRFKTINDSLGHHVGDGLLRSVAQRLGEAVRGRDTVCRLGGDEFVVILHEVQDQAEIRSIVDERLVPRIRAPHDVAGAELHVSCSVGVAVFPDDARDIDSLMRHADAAMYQAKAAGRDAARFFTPELNREVQERLMIESRLRHAVERGELRLAVQPRVDARSRRVVGVEALLRWHHPELGEVPPGRFIPVAEEAGLIVGIGAWVVEAACALVARWREQGIEEVPVAINVSTLQLRDGSLPDRLRRAMAEHLVPRGALEVELTESMLMDSVESNLAQLHEIKAQGVSLAVDDFGTGYSSLTYLNRFPIDRLKVDRSFVRDMLDDPTSHAIVRAIIGLGHTLGMRVVAEGVEHETVALTLQACQCDEFQGYLFARPMDPDDFAQQWLNSAWPAVA